jgi:hypothetical protein
MTDITDATRPQPHHNHRAACWAAGVGRTPTQRRLYHRLQCDSLVCEGLARPSGHRVHRLDREASGPPGHQAAGPPVHRSSGRFIGGGGPPGRRVTRPPGHQAAGLWGCNRTGADRRSGHPSAHGAAAGQLVVGPSGGWIIGPPGQKGHLRNLSMLSGGRSNPRRQLDNRMDCRSPDNLKHASISSMTFARSQMIAPDQDFDRSDYVLLCCSNRSGAAPLYIPQANYILGPTLQKVEQSLCR